MRIEVDPEALSILEQNVRENSGLVLVIGGGCCEGTSIQLFREFEAGPDMTKLGEILGVPLYASNEFAALYKDYGLRVGVEKAPCDDSFSLEVAEGYRFRLKIEPP